MYGAFQHSPLLSIAKSENSGNNITLITNAGDYSSTVYTPNDILTVVYFDDRTCRSFVQKVANQNPDVKFFRINTTHFPKDSCPSCIRSNYYRTPVFVLYKKNNVVGRYYCPSRNDYSDTMLKRILKGLVCRYRVRPQNVVRFATSDKDFNEKEICAQENKVMVVSSGDSVPSYVQDVANANPDVDFLMIPRFCTATRKRFHAGGRYLPEYYFYRDNIRVGSLSYFKDTDNYELLKDELEKRAKTTVEKKVIYINNAGDFGKV